MRVPIHLIPRLYFERLAMSANGTEDHVAVCANRERASYAAVQRLDAGSVAGLGVVPLRTIPNDGIVTENGPMSAIVGVCHPVALAGRLDIQDLDPREQLDQFGPPLAQPF